MKSFLMKLNHVSTFSGKGQLEINKQGRAFLSFIYKPLNNSCHILNRAKAEGENMKTKISIFFVCIGMLLCFANVRWAYAGDGVQLAGNILTYALPATIAGLTISHRDSKGALEFCESAALTLGVTYALKYSIKEERPIGGPHSFPSGHASFSFS